MICSIQDEALWQSVSHRARQLSNVEFLPAVPYREVQGHFDQSEIFVNTSEHEGVPNTFIHSGLGYTAILSLVVDPDRMFENFRAGMCAAGHFERLVQAAARCFPSAISLLRPSKNPRASCANGTRMKQMFKPF